MQILNFGLPIVIVNELFQLDMSTKMKMEINIKLMSALLFQLNRSTRMKMEIKLSW